MAVTVTYLWPATAAATTPPTAAQMGPSPAAEVYGECRASVIAAADADTTATITHNMNLSTGELAAGLPRVNITELLQVSGGLSAWAVTAITATTVVLTKSVAAGSGNAAAQLVVYISRATITA